jgi:hypothetical protein
MHTKTNLGSQPYSNFNTSYLCFLGGRFRPNYRTPPPNTASEHISVVPPVELTQFILVGLLGFGITLVSRVNVYCVRAIGNAINVQSETVTLAAERLLTAEFTRVVRLLTALSTYNLLAPSVAMIGFNILIA